MVAGYRLTASERLFGVANHLFLTLFALATLYPFWFVLQGSFTDPGFPLRSLWPRGFYYANYQQVFTVTGIWKAYVITIARVGVAVPLTLMVTGGAAFALTRPEFVGRNAVILLFFITMFINGGTDPLLHGAAQHRPDQQLPGLRHTGRVQRVDDDRHEDLVPEPARRAGGGGGDRRRQLPDDLLPDRDPAVAADDRHDGACSTRCGTGTTGSSARST